MKANLAVSVFALILALSLAELGFRWLYRPESRLIFDDYWQMREYEFVTRSGSGTDMLASARYSPYAAQQYHPTLGIALEPNFRSRAIKSGIYDVDLVTNNYGFRDKRDYSEDRIPGVGRTVILGDSFTFGEGVSGDQIYPFLLDGGLDDADVYNLGVHGYGNDQMLLLLRQVGIRFQPDLVIVGLYPDDLFRNILDFRGYSKPRFVVEEDVLTLTNVPTLTEAELVARHAKSPERLRPLRNRVCERVFLCLYAHGKLVGNGLRWWSGVLEREEWMLFRSIRRETRDVARDNGAAILVVNLKINANKEYLLFADQLSRFFRDEGIAYINMRPIFQGRSQNSLTIKGDGHPSYSAHAIIASTIHDYLLQEGFTEDIELENFPR